MNIAIKSTIRLYYIPRISADTTIRKAILYEVLYKPWEVVGADIFFVKNKTLLYILDYYNKFPIKKKAGSLAADDLVKASRIVFAEFGYLDSPRNLFQMQA